MTWVYFILVAVVVDLVILGLFCYALAKATPRIMAGAIRAANKSGRSVSTGEPTQFTQIRRRVSS